MENNQTGFDPESITRLVEKQKLFSGSQKTKNISYRLDCLRRLKRVIRDREESLYDALWQDLHKSHQEACLTEINVVLQELDGHIRHLKRWAAPKRVSTPLFMLGSRSRIEYEPYGTVLIIAPWNYPFQLLINPLVGVLSAGNCAVLKPSPLTPHVNRVIAKLISETFDPEHVAFVEGDAQTYRSLLTQRFDYLFFTGSPKSGREVMVAAAENLIPVTLELGGKSPCVVDVSADIDISARRIVWGKFLNAGQTCVAPDYLFVHKDIRDRLLDRMIHYIRQFYGPNPKESTNYPRMITSTAAERIRELLTRHAIIYGGEVDAPERYVAPTLVEATTDSPLMQDEIFGPVLPVLVFADFTEVVRYVGSCEKPLALYYFGRKEHAFQLTSQVSSGGVCINDVVLHLANPCLPFGGVGNSGMGRYHGRFSFETFSHTKAVLRSSVKIDFSVKYPPYKPMSIIKKLTRM